MNKKIHFIGIGGIGVSALAQYYLAKGDKVSGSDLVSSEIIKYLQRKGAEVFIGNHKAKNLLKGVDLVVYSPAVKRDNLELLKAKSYKIKTISYPQALGELTKQYFTIAVSGTHGKSTTASMISLVLIKAGLDPTVIIGTKLREFGNSNFRKGKSEYLVIEADEYVASFLNYRPRVIVLTNIEKDHLDYYKNFGNILKTYKKYIHFLLETGTLVANKDDKRMFQLLGEIKQPKYLEWYSLNQTEAKDLKKILKIPGDHNISNALAALTLARVLGISDKVSFKALSEYKGSWRRFEIKESTINNKQLTVISDYAHHPTEIKATLKAVREKFPNNQILCIFQPHQYQRTFYLWKDFLKVFQEAPIDKAIITDIYDVAGREEKKIKKEVSAKKLVKAINKQKVIYLPKKDIFPYCKDYLNRGEIVIIMGAGDIYELVDRFST
ncbi:MAG: UDP-N-acetylmuramate--L-alanine ligase [Parcubacteria group bacterium]|nr:UDP-N-acetylmuramate--L-alanine ligase [Parcubacteria group bacterium]|tara:strand:- start:406 stop:1722 length:1317 start_codon:yes stop_codon:yes gene_type:complete